MLVRQQWYAWLLHKLWRLSYLFLNAPWDKENITKEVTPWLLRNLWGWDSWSNRWQDIPYRLISVYIPTKEAWILVLRSRKGSSGWVHVRSGLRSGDLWSATKREFIPFSGENICYSCVQDNIRRNYVNHSRLHPLGSLLMWSSKMSRPLPFWKRKIVLTWWCDR